MNDTSNEKTGFVSFSMSVIKFPELADPTSNIRFMSQKNFNGLLVSGFKEAYSVRIETFNPFFGGAQKSYDIRKLLEAQVNDGYRFELYWNEKNITIKVNHEESGNLEFDFELKVGDVAPFFKPDIPLPEHKHLSPIFYAEVISISNTHYMVRPKIGDPNLFPPMIEILKEKYAQLVYADKPSLEEYKRSKLRRL